MLPSSLGLLIPGWHSDVSSVPDSSQSQLSLAPGYYSPIFTTFQQKDISGILTILWQDDPSKAKWSILAKGYSVIRDSKGKLNAPLDVFLAINGPFIGVIAPEAYLDTLGWRMAVGDTGHIGITRDEGVDIAHIDQSLLTSTISVDDIIQNSIEHGFIAEDGEDLSLPLNEPTLTMASSAQPVQVTSISNIAVSPSIGAATTTNIAGVDTHVTTAGNSDEMDNRRAWAELLQIQAEIEAEDQAKKQATVAAANEETDVVLAADEVVEDPNFMLASDFYTLEGEYPFNNEFDPDLSGFEFEPFMGDAFTPYNMSDWVNPEAFEEDAGTEN